MTAVTAMARLCRAVTPTSNEHGMKKVETQQHADPDFGDSSSEDEE